MNLDRNPSAALRTALAAAAIAIATCPFALSQSLDPTFGFSGGAEYEFVPGDPEYGQAAASDSQGRLLVGATLLSGAGVVRFELNGQLDTSFGTGGAAVFPRPFDPQIGERKLFVRALAVDSLDRILLAGSVQVAQPRLSENVFVARMLADATPDPGFGNSGFFEFGLDWGGNEIETARDLIVTGSRILVAGSVELSTSDTDMLLVAVTDQGTLDTSFWWGSGYRTVHFDLSPQAMHDQANGVTVDPATGNVFLCGSAGDLNHVAVAALTTNGDPIGSFGNAGKVTFQFDNWLASSCSDLAFGPNDTVVLAGTARPFLTGQDLFGLARLTAAGVLDTGFATGGVFMDSLGAHDAEATSLAIDLHDRVVVAGTIRQASSLPFDYQVGVLRLLQNGVPDTSFGSFGSITAFFPSAWGPVEVWAADLLLDAQERPVVVGTGLPGFWSVDNRAIALRFLP